MINEYEIHMWKCRHCGEEMLAINREGHRDEHAWQHQRLVREMAMTRDAERLQFIRQAALTRAADLERNIISQTEAQVEQTCDLAWSFARALWATKPDDC